MKHLLYGVAASALLLGAGGVAVACDQHAHSAALTTPAAATQAFNGSGAVLAQSQTDSDSAKSDDEEKKPEALPGRADDRVLAQMQQDQSGTSGDSGNKEDSEPKSDDQK